MKFEDVKEHWHSLVLALKWLLKELLTTLWVLVKFLFSNHPNICWVIIVGLLSTLWLLSFTKERINKNAAEKKVFMLEQKIDSIQQRHTSYIKPTSKDIKYLDTNLD